MKSVIICLVIILFSMGVSGQDQMTITASKDNSFTVKHPQSWEARTEAYGDNQMVTIKAPTTDRVTVAISKGKAPSMVHSQDELVKEMTSQLMKQMSVTSFAENKKIGNKQVLKYQIEGRGKIYKMKTWLWYQKGFAFTANFGASPENYTNYENTADMIVASIGNDVATASGVTQSTGISKAAPEIVEIDLSSNPGFNIIVKAASGAKAELKYGTVIKLSDDKRFQVGIEKTIRTEIESTKKYNADNQLNVVKKYIIDEPNGILWQSEAMGRSEYHFEYVYQSGNNYYAFKDQRGVIFTLDEIKLMYKAASETITKGSTGSAVPAKPNTTVTTDTKSNNSATTNNGKPTDPSDDGVNYGDVPPENGKWIARDEKGKIVAKGQFKDGQITGHWFFYKDGILETESDYLKGKLNGKKIDYFTNGNKQQEVDYIKGVKDGTEIYYDMNRSTPLRTWHYSNGELEGSYTEYTSDGVLLEEGMYVKGKKEGEWKKYTRDGKLKETKLYKEGKLQE